MAESNPLGLAQAGIRTAVVAPADPSEPPSLDELRDHLRGSLAGYKLPKHLVLVDRVERSPAGKPDYRWAKRMAEGDDAPPSAPT